MKYILTILITVTTLLSANYKLANQESEFNTKILQVASELEEQGVTLTIFNDTKIYKKNGALLGLINKNIDFAFVKNSFLNSISKEKIEEKRVKGTEIEILLLGNNYSLVAKADIEKRISKEKLEKFLAIIEKNLKDM